MTASHMTTHSAQSTATQDGPVRPAPPTHGAGAPGIVTQAAAKASSARLSSDAPRRRVKAVVFDIDDTICDSTNAFRMGIDLVIEHYMPALDPQQRDEAYRLWCADPNGHYRSYTRGECNFDEQRMARANELNRHFGGPVISKQEYFDTWKPLFWDTFCANWRAHDDVRPCLDALRTAGIALGAISNASSQLQQRKLKACGCAGEVPLLVTMDTFGFGKPDRRVFDEAARKLGLETGEVAYVGDEFDIDAQAACVAGMRGFWIDRPSRHSEAKSRRLPDTSLAWAADTVTRLESLEQLPDEICATR
ncbi:MAG: HAD family hydrolase [Bifidobacteriaceae bacterium]|nr:HAD family hydrolase [Bifidobacteriaceae bacterium]